LIAAMPRPRKPHLHRERNRHGVHVWYVRKGKGVRYRLRAEYGSDDFNRQYEAAIQGKLPKRGQATAGTLQWLWDAYRKTDGWKALSTATRKQRENIMLHVLKAAGEEPFGAIGSEDIQDGLDRRSDTPSAARNFLDTMRGLFQWARSRGHVRRDPTQDVKPPKRRRNAGFAPWTHEDVDAYYKRWPLGTRQRVWIDVLLYTGLRRGDAADVGPRHVNDGLIEIATEKSGRRVLVVLPILDVLQATLDAGPIGDETWIVSAHGTRFVKEAFGNAFSEAASAAGVKKSAHGVRKIAATIAAENGATEAELDAIFGWTGGRMASHYTKTANRTKLAKQAAEKLKSIPSPYLKVGAPSDKVQTNQTTSEGLVGEAEVKSSNPTKPLPESEGQ
jgi:integrase